MARLKEDLNKSSTEMANLFGVSTGRSWRKYMASDANNKREMSMHMLFYAMARLELDETTLNRILDRMRAVGATIDLDQPDAQA
ncbi:XRE family transcriptional regulator [Robbsia andropogonis]|uniref:XRE family transcriptional regulator n=1 Tax=Robbsia andropogonis TaxID=28092 RepID=UPI003D20B429